MVAHIIQENLCLRSIPLRPGSVCQESAMETIQKRTVLSWTELFHLGKKQHNNSISQPSRKKTGVNSANTKIISVFHIKKNLCGAQTVYDGGGKVFAFAEYELYEKECQEVKGATYLKTFIRHEVFKKQASMGGFIHLFI